ncbi:MAG: hypothetical protein JST82_07770 [Bacteroidetes bacterium]|nr:hypothetical protein [Bacteroidota bacterium]
MRTVFAALFILCTMNIHAQTSSAFGSFKDKENGSMVYKGQITFQDLHEQLSFTWLDKGVAEYKPDSVTLDYLKQHLLDYDMTIILGTWCSDSKEMIPKLYKILQITGYPLNKLMMYGVDRNKTTLGGEEKLYKLVNVPTIILYKKYHEKGRIVETVHKSVEKDLKAIIEKDLEQTH